MDEVVATKKCAKCGEVKKIGEFNKNKRNKDGFQCRCKQCIKVDSQIFYKNNKIKILLHYQNNKEKILKYAKEYRQSHKEYFDKYAKEYRQLNRNYFSEYGKEYRKNNKWRFKEYQERYYQNNKEKFKMRTSLYNSRKLLLPSELTRTQWNDTVSFFNGTCAYCGKPNIVNGNRRRMTQDHFVAVTKGGGYTKENIVPACKRCNCSKSNKDFSYWYPYWESYSPEREQKILAFLAEQEEVEVAV